MARYTFANVGQWAEQTEQRKTAVFRDAALSIAEAIKTTRDRGGQMRVDTNLLRSSLMASTAAMPQIDPNKTPVDGMRYPDTDAQIELVIAGADLNETIYLGFTAAYARPREYLDGFVRLSVQRWPQIVEASARRIKAGVDARS